MGRGRCCLFSLVQEFGIDALSQLVHLPISVGVSLPSFRKGSTAYPRHYPMLSSDSSRRTQSVDPACVCAGLCPCFAGSVMGAVGAVAAIIPSTMSAMAAGTTASSILAPIVTFGAITVGAASAGVVVGVLTGAVIGAGVGGAIKGLWAETRADYGIDPSVSGGDALMTIVAGAKPQADAQHREPTVIDLTGGTWTAPGTAGDAIGDAAPAPHPTATEGSRA